MLNWRMTASGGGLLLAPALAAGIGLATPGWAAEAPSGRVYLGESVAIGHGSARVVVRSDAKGRPATVAVIMTEGALDGLPAELNRKALPVGLWGYALPMPRKWAKTGIDHVEIDWNPQGHLPPGIYSVPHFDFHFYGVSRAAQAKVKFTGADDPGARAPDAALPPPDYKFVAETAIRNMGVHAIDMTSPEFQGKPFTATFIYGYYRGRLTFMEPMVTRAFLLTKPDISSPVKAPDAYSRRGYYPTSYSVRYDEAAKGYVIELGGLRAGGPKTRAAGGGGKRG